MPLEFRETFPVRAPVDAVWRLLLDPAQVVHCMPGASFIGSDDERTHRGQVTAKVGPVTATYAGRATFVEIDHSAHRARIVGEGKEGTGSGSARMTIDLEVRPLADGGSEVELAASVDVVGRVMQLGRGMLESVARQLLRQFTECVRAKIEALATAEPTTEEARREVMAPAPVRPFRLVLRAIIDWILAALRRRQAPR